MELYDKISGVKFVHFIYAQALSQQMIWSLKAVRELLNVDKTHREQLIIKVELLLKSLLMRPAEELAKAVVQLETKM